MSSNFKKFTLAAGLVLTMGYMVGCGTRGENTGFSEDNGSGGGGGGVATGSSAAASAGTGGGLTGGATGSATANSAFPATAVTGLTVSNMLPATSGGGGGSGASNPPTRLGMGNFAFGVRPAVLQGFGISTLGSGRVTILPRNPDGTTGANNVVLTPTVGSASPLTITNPFGMLVDGSTVYVGDQAIGAGIGRIVRYTNIVAGGGCTADQLAINLNSPVDIARDGTFLYVAEYGSSGGLGRISRIDISSGAAFPNVTTFVQSVNFCTSIAIDNANGHRFLYLVENVAGSSGGANGGVARIDLNTFVPNTPLLTGGVGSTASAGVTLIPPAAGQTAYNNPFDIVTDGFSNVVVTEGVNAGTSLLTPTANPGALRVITGGATPATTSRVVLQNTAAGTATGLNALRGVNLFNEDASGSVVSAFFTEGNTIGTTTTMRQLTFRVADAAIFRHLQLDSGKLAPLDTLFDPGDAASSPAIRANVKYCTGSFNGGTNGQVLDVR